MSSASIYQPLLPSTMLPATTTSPTNFTSSEEATPIIDSSRQDFPSSIPLRTWSRRLDEKEPSSNLHTFSRPPVFEALKLLPVAYRVGSYIYNEISQNKEPIFDLRGITLEPPNPGPHGGVPCGGLGGGAIGRGYRGDFRRWSIQPGRYVHHVVSADCFAVRVKRSGPNVGSKPKIESCVLSLMGKESLESDSCLKSWDWSLNASNGCQATYHAVFPRSWTVFKDLFSDIDVTIKQLSPFLPHSYSEASLPVTVFDVEVENKSTRTDEVIEVSVMFVFQNGYQPDDLGYGGNSDDSVTDENQSTGHTKGVGRSMDSDCPRKHYRFTMTHDDRNYNSEWKNISGVVMTNHRTRLAKTVSHSEDGTTSTLKETFVEVKDRGSYAIAAGLPFASNTQETSETITYCEKFITRATGYCDNEGNLPGLFDGYGLCPQDDSGSSSHSQSFDRVEHDSDDEDTNGLHGGSMTMNRGDEVTDTSLAPPRRRGKKTTTIPSDSNEKEIEIDRDRQTDINSDNNNKSYCLSSTSSSTTQWGRTAYLLWQRFHHQGDICNCNEYLPGSETDRDTTLPYTVGSAVCVRQSIPPNSMKTFSFSLAWDYPIARFGSGHGLPRYYTRFFTGIESASEMSTYALLNKSDWEKRIVEWQESTLSRYHSVVHPTRDSSSNRDSDSEEFYDYHLFNELYFLVDGGTLWLDSSYGQINVRQHDRDRDSMIGVDSIVVTDSNIEIHHNTTSNSGHDIQGEIETIVSSIGSISIVSHDKYNIGLPCKKVSLSSLNRLKQTMLSHDEIARGCGGDQSIVGQFLYLEGHEYLMYNTYDVHFYASFALIMLWPELELSLQRDFAHAVHQEDNTVRRMMGEGYLCTRKVKGVVPHDVGSPSEEPFTILNAYNFQDVSRWKDLGSKFILQVYRDYCYVTRKNHTDYIGKDSDIVNYTSFLRTLYPTMLHVMEHMLEHFDTNNDGMIENSGFPDQTYDIWEAKGIHAYCGGLWITACEAIVCMTNILYIDDSNEKQRIINKFNKVIKQGRDIYIKELYHCHEDDDRHGKGEKEGYLHYDNSTSHHSDSIMADMLAGQWYALSCTNLSPPLQSIDMTRQCLQKIYDYNVVKFAHIAGHTRVTSQGKKELIYIGAVNGMRPNGTIDMTCLQSREVWTGTTYALAAMMLYQSLHYASPSHSSTATVTVNVTNSLTTDASDDSPISTPLSPLIVSSSVDANVRNHTNRNDITAIPTSTSIGDCDSHNIDNDDQHKANQHLRDLFVTMAENTARGIHDGGWQEFGYWFATPEGWEKNGNYRSLGYMRALCIWAMQYAAEQYYVENNEK